MTLNKQYYTESIKAKAIELGFSACGISKAEYLEEYEPLLKNSVSKGYNGEMKYLSNNIERRVNLPLLLPNAASVISLLINYYSPEKQNKDSFYKISQYAYGRDYHKVIKQKLTKLEEYIKELLTDVETISLVDSSPILEKAIAKKSGLGWIGKNCLLINKEYGTFCFISEIMLDKELEYDKQWEKDLCGNCNKCIEACPTKALVLPNVLDARRCIAYNTIELRHDMPEDISGKLDNRIYGCDVCQDVCPWNKELKFSTEPGFIPSQELLAMTKDDWENLTEEKFNDLFKESAVKRTKFEGLTRNIKLIQNQNKPFISNL